MQKYNLLILSLILIIGSFFRTYKVVERFEFAHDGDLYSWIVKDIAIDHHFRLIGQLTSAPGIFIGPLFYYSLVPFFILTKMDPIGSLILVTLLGLFTIFSYYFVLSKLFTKKVGLIGAFLYAVLIATISNDRWVVPTVTTSIWSIWYFYAIIKLARGEFFVFPFLGVLIGLIWDVHIALIPTLLALPVALFTSRKIPSVKQIFLFFISLTIISLPLIFFELRHNFGQAIALFHNFTFHNEGVTGLKKFMLVLQMIIQNTNLLFFAPQSFKSTQNLFFLIMILTSPLSLIKAKLISISDLLPLYSWIIGLVLFFSVSSSPISEYYFSNIGVIFIAFVSLILVSIANKSRILSCIVVGLLTFISLKNAYFLVTQDTYHKGYLERKAIVETIKKDMFTKNYPCAGITYITTPGENVGFRYLFYLNNIHLTHPTLSVPVYNIVIPDELSQKEVKQKFGHIGIILPEENYSKNYLQKICSIEDTNLTDSVFGFVK